jgi:hypothetical protein
MSARDLFHGTNGDNILQIMQDKLLKPSDGKLFFSEGRPDSVLMHGADVKRKLTFAIKARVQIPAGVELLRHSTPGVADTLVLKTTAAVPVEILELYVRRPQATSLEVVSGAEAIKRFLDAAALLEAQKVQALTQLKFLLERIRNQLDLYSNEHAAQQAIITNINRLRRIRGEPAIQQSHTRALDLGQGIREASGRRDGHQAAGREEGAERDSSRPRLLPGGDEKIHDLEGRDRTRLQ